MNDIIKKRNDLINYFLNEDKTYNKQEVLHREAAVLSFSPREEYIDNVITPFEHMLTDFDEIDDNSNEFFIKGIIVDIDNKKGYSIIHIQNKNLNKSISCQESLVRRYNDYIELGHVILVCCHSYNGKLYMHFMIDYTVNDSFLMEENYMNGVPFEQIDNLDVRKYHNNIALVQQATYFTSKKGTNCLRILAYQGGESKTLITCFNLPNMLMTGMFIEYQQSQGSFVNNVRQIKL